MSVRKKQQKKGSIVCHRYEEAVCTIYTNAWELMETLANIFLTT